MYKVYFFLSISHYEVLASMEFNDVDQASH